MERESATHDTELNKSELNEKTEEKSVRHHKNTVSSVSATSKEV